MSKPGRPSKADRKGPAKNKYGLRLHGNGQWCKKIRGKRWYFGTDFKLAEQDFARRLRQIELGEMDPEEAAQELTLGELAVDFLRHCEARVTVEEIGERQYRDLGWHLARFEKHLGAARKVVTIKTPDLQDYRTHLINEGLAGNSVNRAMGAVKRLFHWAHDNEKIFTLPNLRAVKKVTVRIRKRQVFTREQIRDLITVANTNMRAMIWLGVNCGLGCTDCALIRWENLDLQSRRMDYPRIKTGIDRNLRLWPETIAALEAVRTWSVNHRRPVGPEDLVFRTKQGNPYVQLTAKTRNPDSALTKEFLKVMRKAKIDKAKGTGFYTLRRTGATFTAKSRDVWAVKGFLGHAGLDMATHYVQQDQLTPQTDEATECARRLLTGEDPVTAAGTPPPKAPAGDSDAAGASSTAAADGCAG
ncbi:MAG: tyrosine-type recombinase/integrase [Planctomycetes bacterium]|nr:tyrosine-type recombinase/integrase [Planctomycetota bacterium]